MNEDEVSLKLPVETLPAPTSARRRLDLLTGQRTALQQQQEKQRQQLQAIQDYLGIAAAVESALDELSQKLFGDLIKVIETQLTSALLDVLDQPLALKVERDFKRGSVTMQFQVECAGQREDIMRGQGGSVANVLSVGLRLLALTTLDPKRHRKFLVLDEPDCWLRPDLVPRLVKVVHQAGKVLGFQVLMISHHDINCFDGLADRIYRFTPGRDGLSVSVTPTMPKVADEG